MKYWKNLYQISFGLALSLVLSGILLVSQPERIRVWAATPPGDVLGHQTLNSLGKFTKAGSVTLPADFSAQFGTNKIEWAAGQRPVDAIPVGVWDTAFKVGKLSVAQINPTLDMAAAGLANYGFLKKTSIADLTAGLPSIASLNIVDVKPLAALVTEKIAAGLTLPTIDLAGIATPITSVADLIKVPEWKDLPLANDLSSFAAADLPGLANTPIGNFPKVLSNPAAAFPGLANMPIVNMPGFNLPAGYQIGYFDAIRTKEPVVRKVISGSREQPNAKCESKNCNHAEVQAMIGGVLSGAQIVDGDTQTVSGGYGFLRAIASTEPAGMQPYGEPIQEVYSNFNAQSGDVDRSWYFNICNHGWIDWGCSAHFIGPIPIGSLHEGDKTPLLLGNISIPIQAPKIAKLPSLPAILKTAAAPSTPTAPKAAPIVKPAPAALNLPALSTKIATAIPQADPKQVASILKSKANQIDPATNKQYSPSAIIRQTVEELIGGSNSPLNSNTTSLALGETIDTLVGKIQNGVS